MDIFCARESHAARMAGSHIGVWRVLSFGASRARSSLHLVIYYDGTVIKLIAFDEEHDVHHLDSIKTCRLGASA